MKWAFAILSSKLIRIQSKDLVMTCGPVFYAGTKGIREKALDWYESFFLKYPIPAPVRVWKEGAKKPKLGPVGYVQKVIPIKHWLWQKLSDSHCRKGTLLISPKTHIRTSWVCSKVDTHQTLVVMETVWFSL